MPVDLYKLLLSGGSQAQEGSLLLLLLVCLLQAWLHTHRFVLLSHLLREASLGSG